METFIAIFGLLNIIAMLFIAADSSDKQIPLRGTKYTWTESAGWFLLGFLLSGLGALAFYLVKRRRILKERMARSEEPAPSVLPTPQASISPVTPAPLMVGAFCPACGQPHEPTAAFCAACGAKLGVAAVPPVAAPPVPSPAPLATTDTKPSTAKIWLVVAGGVIVLATLAFMLMPGEQRAEVKCSGADNGIVCSVHHVQGNQRLSVSWDIEITCRNGTAVTASGTQMVEPGQTVSKTIPASDVKNLYACDTGSTFAVKNVRIAAAQ